MIKYLNSENTNPYENLAIEQHLFSKAKENPILFLWQNEHTIVIGRNQIPKCECKAYEFFSNGGRIARRRSGGGAVYHDYGNLNYSIICPENMVEIYSYQSIVRNALQSFGLKIGFNGRNDLMVNDRKISGNAVYSENGIICQHGTILVNTDLDIMQHYLTPDKEKMTRNHVESIKSRVVNLSELCESISVKDVKNALVGSTEAVPLLDDMDLGEIEKLTAFYASDTWIYGGKR